VKPAERKLARIQLPEWKSEDFPGLGLTPEDRRFAGALANPAELRLSVDELRTGLRISASSWVGVVRFSTFELHVVPKLAGRHLGLVRLIDYASGIDCLERHPGFRDLEGQEESLFDLIALLLAEACERLVRTGLLADYLEVEETLPVLRGRLLPDRQVMKHHARIDRLECRHDEQGANILENQALLLALTACAPLVRDPLTALRVRRMQGVLAEACSIDEFDARSAREMIFYNRLNEHYREAHNLAWLVLDGLGISDIFAGGDHRCFAFMLDMNRLFEDFITRWLTTLVSASEYRVLPQQRDHTILWDANGGKPYGKIIPDLLVEKRSHPGQFLAVDAKYKLYDERAISPADVYQTFLYAMAYGGRHGPLPTALLIYPSSTDAMGRARIHVRQSGSTTKAQLSGLGINIPTAIQEARLGHRGPQSVALLDLIDTALGRAKDADTHYPTDRSPQSETA
jgi:5-methylcytosine-specific restriction enzyme subunit McrC